MSTPTARDPQTAAYMAVAEWIEGSTGRALVGCTPSMVAGVALTAYRRAGAEPTLVENVRAELDEATSHMRALADSNLGLVTWANAYHAERDELAERVEELEAELGDAVQQGENDAEVYRHELVERTSQRDELAVRVQELEAEIEEIRAYSRNET